ncbi:FtsK/SpoIIIE domain-containing protein [Frigoribacterium faeni]|uniref:Cell division protein FtsK n=1 Tax=Frigoribacterium faeni TaxID=145483 RepID=A0A7W3PJM7_9MICO|nr:FtsK/SpoIIIE domain-containing protein [Frigoribacterium faeni]MBA8814002.1 S-DNA-T family DNA segregation ATPase FtsK/SpoIIIE [Frigoribacterium faeni]GEK82618.1 cell division protein FtsK [Frigoribacterium faeni]
MRVGATVRHEPSHRTADFVWEVEPTTTLGDVVDHAAARLGVRDDVRRHVAVDGRYVDPGSTVADAAFVDGSVISFGSPPSIPAPPDDLPTVRIIGGPGAGTIFVLDPGIAVIGSGGGATIVLDDPHVPPLAAALTFDGAGRFVIEPAVGPDHDLVTGSRTDGLTDVLVDRRRITTATPVDDDSVITIGGTLLAVTSRGGPLAATTVADDGGLLDYARPPRLLPDEPPSAFRYPPEPQPPARRPLPIVAAIAPLVMAVVMVSVFDSMGFLAFGLMSPVVLIGNYLYDRRNGRISHRRRLADHEETTAAVAADAAVAVREIEARRRASSPDPAALLDIAMRRRARLWERRRAHDDHLAVRIGTADVPSGVTVEDPAELEHRRVVARAALDVPVCVTLTEHGVVGLAGRTADTRSLATWLVAQLCVLQSPRDVEIVVLTDPDGVDSWSWLRWVPHARGGESADRTVRVGVDAATVARRLAELGRLVDARERAVRESPGHDVTTGPDIVVVVDGARRLRTLPGLVPLVRDGPAVGVYAICLDADARSLPEECLAVVTCGRSSHTVAVDRSTGVQSVRADLLPAGWHDAVARGLSPLVDVGEEDDAAGLPTRSRLLDVLDLDTPTAASIRARWNVTSPTTGVVIGHGLDGAFSFDLRVDGPHGLVAGTTGSGKSELLQSIVASLASSNTPDAMTFVLIDYKGGAAFRDLAALPHTVGVVTDLDPHLVERALDSLGAELRRREHLLADAGAKDIEDYLDPGHGSTTAPTLPRLVIVIDEFASLARELPDFVTGLVNIAQRGRSLGIHLILATQRPTGVVTGDIRANTNLRIALRVTDAAESTDVIDASDAAGISKANPGRAFARLGAGALLPFQAGRVGGRAPGAVAPVARRLWGAVVETGSLGHPPPGPPEEARVDRADETDLVQLVAAIAAAEVDRGGAPPHRPWLDALPDAVTLEEIRRQGLDTGGPRATADEPGALAPLLFGLEDHPDRQSRAAAVLDLDLDGHLFIAGSARSGRSQALRALAASIASGTSAADVHLYGLDCGSGALLPLVQLPHAGAVVQRTEIERTRRLLARLVRECHRRQEILASGGHAGVVEQRRGAAVAERLPHLVLLIDRWEGFVSALGELDGGHLVDQVTSLLREGASVGLHLVVTGDRQLITGRFSTLVDRKVILRLADRSDYALAGLDPRRVPDDVSDGRAFVADSGVELQIALIGPDASGRAQAADLARLGAAASEHDAGLASARRPFRLDRLDGPLGFDDAWARRRVTGTGGLFALVGVGGDELTAVGPDLADGSGTFMIGGPGRSGRSTLLLSIIRSLVAVDAEVVVMAPRASPLRRLDGAHGVLTVLTGARPTEADVAPWFDDGPGRRVLVIDDADLLRDAPVSTWLSRFVTSCSDRGQGLVVAGSSAELATGFGGWVADIRRNRCGAVLSPQSAVDGDVVGAALPKSSLSSARRLGIAHVNVGAGEVVQVRVPFG